MSEDTTTTETVTETTAPETTTTAPAKAGPLTLKPTTSETTQPQTETGTAKPDLILGKYKDQAALEKAYTELETKLGKPAAVPEQYDFEPLAKDGVVKFDTDEQRAGFEKVLKDAGVSQEVLAKSGPAIQMLAQQAATAAISAAQKEYAEQFGGPIDVPAQLTKLRGAWGDQFESKFQVVSDWLNSQPATITEMPIGWSAEGMQWAYDRLAAGRGPTLIKPNDTAPGGNLESLRAQLTAATKGAYRKQGPEGDKARAEASRLAGEIARLEGRTR